MVEYHQRGDNLSKKVSRLFLYTQSCVWSRKNDGAYIFLAGPYAGDLGPLSAIDIPPNQQWAVEKNVGLIRMLGDIVLQPRKLFQRDLADVVAQYHDDVVFVFADYLGTPETSRKTTESICKRLRKNSVIALTYCRGHILGSPSWQDIVDMARKQVDSSSKYGATLKQVTLYQSWDESSPGSPMITITFQLCKEVDKTEIIDLTNLHTDEELLAKASKRILDCGFPIESLSRFLNDKEEGMAKKARKKNEKAKKQKGREAALKAWATRRERYGENGISST